MYLLGNGGHTSVYTDCRRGSDVPSKPAISNLINVFTINGGRTSGLSCPQRLQRVTWARVI